jgi:hypothetical protein
MKKRCIAIFTHSGDLHASQFVDIAISQKLSFRLVFTDHMSLEGNFSIYPNSKQILLTDVFGEKFSFEEITAVWWRRISSLQQGLQADNEHSKFIESTWKNLFEGDFRTITNKPVFVNDPIKTKKGYNKVSQLEVAKRSGFNIPDTLISNSYIDILNFCQNKTVIIKPMITDTRFPIYVNEFDSEKVSENDIKICPSIFQEKLNSTVNYRVNVFGDNIYSFRIENERMDWRTGNSKMTFVKLSKSLEESSFHFIKKSGLKMGCIDLKESSDGNIYFLENNPQGQFSFLEATTGYPLMTKFVQYIYSLPPVS